MNNTIKNDLEESKKQHINNLTSPAIAAKRFFARNPKTLSTSRSTPSLPDLVNYAITSATASLSKRQVVDLSTTMRRGHSQQAAQVCTKSSEQPKKQT
jgi:hypothetical protein